jgi:hypothetical protein
MSTRTTDAEFSWLIGQRIKGIDLAYPALAFDAGTLFLNCAWRLRDDEVVHLGSAEFDENLAGERFGRLGRLLVDLLMNRTIEALRHDAIVSDLSLYFEGGLRLDAFSDSALYEGWEISGPHGLLVTATPAGSIGSWQTGVPT